MSSEEVHQCAVCSSTQVQVCTGCLTIYYCGAEHQLQDWPNHKPQCSGLNKRSDLLGRAEKSRETRSKSVLDVSRNANINAINAANAANASGASGNVSRITSIYSGGGLAAASPGSSTAPASTTPTAAPAPSQKLSTAGQQLTPEEKEKRQAEREKFMTRGVLPQLQQQLQMKAAAQQKQQVVQIQASNQAAPSNTTSQQSNIKQQIQLLQQQGSNNNTPTQTPPSNTPTIPRKSFITNSNANVSSQNLNSFSAPATPVQPKPSVVLSSSAGAGLSSSTGSQPVAQAASNSAPPSVNTSGDSIDSSVSAPNSSVKNLQSRLGQLNFQIPSSAGPGYRRSVMPPAKSAPMADIQEITSQSTPTSPTNNLIQPIQSLSQSQPQTQTLAQQTTADTLASVEQMLTQLQQITPPAASSTTSTPSTTNTAPGPLSSSLTAIPTAPQSSSAGPASTMPAQKVIPLRTHKKNQSMPDISSNSVLLERQKLLQQHLQQQQQQQAQQSQQSTEEEEEEEEAAIIQYKERNRPKGLRFKDSPIEVDTPVEKQRRSIEQVDAVAAVVETPVVDTNAKSESDSLLAASSEQPADSSADQQQPTAGGRIAEKFNIIRKKAGVVSALTKTKMSEVAQKAKKSLNKDQPQTASENAPQPVASIVDTKIFGQPLPVAIQRAAHAHPLVPDIVFKSIEYLRERGTQEEGIFRLSGSASAISKLKEEFDSGVDVDLSTQLDQHVVSGILKLYLRQIPETLFTEEFPDELEDLRAGGNAPEAVSMRISGITALLKKLPEPNRCILHHLCSLLNIIAFETSTKMTTVNLAIIFAPTLGCPVEVMTVLIDYYEPIFSEQTYNY